MDGSAGGNALPLDLLEDRDTGGLPNVHASISLLSEVDVSADANLYEACPISQVSEPYRLT